MHKLLIIWCVFFICLALAQAKTVPPTHSATNSNALKGANKNLNKSLQKESLQNQNPPDKKKSQTQNPYAKKQKPKQTNQVLKLKKGVSFQKQKTNGQTKLLIKTTQHKKTPSSSRRKVANSDGKIPYEQLVFPSESIYQTVNQHVQNIHNLCQTSLSNKEKLKIFKKNFLALKDYVKITLEEYLKPEDKFFLNDIDSSIKNIHLDLYANTPVVQTANNIHGALLTRYRYSYNVPKSQSVKLTSGWLYSITKGLSCIK